METNIFFPHIVFQALPLRVQSSMAAIQAAMLNPAGWRKPHKHICWRHNGQSERTVWWFQPTPSSRGRHGQCQPEGQGWIVLIHLDPCSSAVDVPSARSVPTLLAPHFTLHLPTHSPNTDCASQYVCVMRVVPRLHTHNLSLSLSMSLSLPFCVAQKYKNSSSSTCSLWVVVKESGSTGAALSLHIYST